MATITIKGLGDFCLENDSFIELCIEHEIVKSPKELYEVQSFVSYGKDWSVEGSIFIKSIKLTGFGKSYEKDGQQVCRVYFSSQKTK